MFDLGFTIADARRAVWAGIFAAAAALGAGVTDWKVLGAAFIAAALSVFKNGVLAEDAPIK